MKSFLKHFHNEYLLVYAATNVIGLRRASAQMLEGSLALMAIMIMTSPLGQLSNKLLSMHRALA